MLHVEKSSDRLVCDYFPMDKGVRVTALRVTDWGVVLDVDGYPARAGFRWDETLRSTLEEFYHGLVWEYEMSVADRADDGSVIPGTERTVWVRDLATNETQAPDPGPSEIEYQVKRWY